MIKISNELWKMITLTVCCGICVELSIRSKSYYFNTTAIYCKLCRLSLIRFQGSCLVFILVPFTFHFLFDFFCNRSLNLSDWNRSVNKYSCRHACAVTMAESELVSFDFEIFGIVQGKESCVLWFYFVYFLLWTWRPDHQCTFRGHALVSCMVHPPYL